MDELLSDFLVETGEHIESAGMQLVMFEHDPSDRSIIASIFRLVHTIKGTCGFLGLTRLGHLTHAAEALMSRLRDGMPATGETVSLILAVVDRVKFILSALEQQASEPEGDDADLLAALEAQLALAADEANTNEAEVPSDDMTAEAGVETAEALLREIVAPEAAADPAPAASIPAAPAPPAGSPSGGVRRPETIRVSVGALERIMILVSELVLTRNQLLEITRRQEDETVKAPLQRLSALTTDLQDAVMRARMQPVGRLFAGLPRLARELSVELGKKIHLVTEGGDTELDRQLIEIIRDPLTHLLRNCADHGLETPEKRIAMGKTEAGTIRVSATHEAGYITIEVSDDGRGLDIPKIREKAIDRGLVGAADAAKLSDDDICRFIMTPAFSTASVVTNVSGRGVGMDVVRENIESIGGSIGMATTFGSGTRFSLKIPLTLAIAPALIVEIGTQRFALPQHSVVEAVGLDGETSLDRVQGSLVLRLRDEVLPVADLRRLLALGDDSDEDTYDGSLVVVMRVGTLACGMIVDGVADVQEIVVKPLGASLAHLDVFSGHTILGDGSVVLILDPSRIASRLGLEQSRDLDVGRVIEPYVAVAEMTRLVVFSAGSGVRKAIPLSLIGRIESVPDSAISYSDGMYVMQHQQQLMPLVPVADTCVGTRDGNHPILVLSVGGESMGLIVDEISDIVEQRLEIEISGSSNSVIGTTQVRDFVVEMLDVTHFMRLARPNAFARGLAKRFNVLLVDDKLFFRDMLAPVLASAGYHVTSASGGQEALTLFEKGARFDAVVTDTDMPEMSGYALAAALLANPRHVDLPIFALAAHAAPAVVRAAQASGMRGAIGKFDRPALLGALDGVLQSQSLGAHTLEAKIIGELAA